MSKEIDKQEYFKKIQELKEENKKLKKKADLYDKEHRDDRYDPLS